MKNEPRPSPRFTRWLIAGNVAVVVIIVTMAASAIYADYVQHRQIAFGRVANVAQVMARYLAGVFDKTDLALRSVAYEYQYHMLGAGGANAPAIRKLVAHQRATLPEVDSIRIATADGVVRFGTDGVDGVRIGDRSYFERARDGDPALLFSEPLLGRITGKWVVVAARRLARPDGSFAGVAFASMTSDYFSGSFAAVDLGRDGAISMRDLGLRLVARHPDPGGSASAIGSANVSAQLRDVLRSGAESGTYIAPTALDGIERLNAYQRVGDLPFYVIVGISSSEWRAAAAQDASAIGSLAALALLLTMGFSWLLHGAWRRRESALAAEKRSSEELARVNKALEELSVRDPLTGLLNRRYLDETMAREIAQAERGARPVSFVLIDLDHFKRLNDTRGHGVGDAVLQAVGELLAASIRAGDLACRYGGEEFLLVLPGTSAQAALQRTDELRRALAGLRLAAKGRPVRVTLSAGVATYPDHGATREELIRKADAALYSAKASGRDCVRLADAEARPAQPVPSA
jgi:diguanylate cyclase (GGDEF)-like protein